MARIFLSYRRDDSAAFVAAALNDKLQERFGSDAVFFDVDSIPFGVDFRDCIANAVGSCDVLLVLIGDNWIRASETQQAGRLDDPTDYVRIEIESALKRDIPVIPVLVGEASMPSMSVLPSSIQSIVFRNAAEIRAGRDLRQHMDRLIQALETMFRSKPPDDAPPPASEPAAAIPEAAPKKARPKAAGKKPAGLQLIVESLDEFTNPYLFLAGNIPTGKLDNALATYADAVAKEDVLLLYDNTVFGGAKDGLLLTNNAVYWHNMSEGAGHIRYADIKTVRSVDGVFTADIVINDKEINLNMGDRNATAKALARVIKRMRDR